MPKSERERDMDATPMTFELHTLIEHLLDEAKKDGECGWPKKAMKKRQAAEMLRRAYADGVQGSSSSDQAAHSKSEYKRRVALGDPNVLPPVTDKGDKHGD